MAHRTLPLGRGQSWRYATGRRARAGEDRRSWTGDVPTGTELEHRQVHSPVESRAPECLWSATIWSKQVGVQQSPNSLNEHEMIGEKFIHLLPDHPVQDYNIIEPDKPAAIIVEGSEGLA